MGLLSLPANKDRTFTKISGICVNFRICGFVEVGLDRCEMAEEICTMVAQKLQLLMSVWADLGFEYEPTRSRFERTKSHIETLLNQIIDSDVEMKETILKKIAQLKDHLHQLCRELSIPLPEFTASLSILEQENTVRKDLEHLKEKKRDRERAQKKLKKKEAELCAKLGAHCLSTCSVSVPSEKDLQEMELRVQGLEREKVDRTCQVSLLRKEIIAELNLLGSEPQAHLKVMNDEEDFILSKNNIDELMAYLDELQQLEVTRRRELAGLQEQLALFFDRLDIPPEEQHRIRSCSTDLTPSTLDALRANLAEYERRKQACLREFITRAKDDLLTWYKKCCVPQCRLYLDVDDSEDISEERLALLEDQLKALKEFYSENKLIIAKSERHEALGPGIWSWKSLRNEIEKFIATYSGSNKIFDLWGKDFLEHKDGQQQAHAQEKKRVRLERDSRRKATPSAPGSSKSSTTLASSRRMAASVGKSSPSVHGGTPVGTSGTAARNIRRRSIKILQFLAQQSERQLTSSVLCQKPGPLRPEAAESVEQLDVNLTDNASLL
nr:protein regulator of cytokinesis 1-like [Rhipicephalus microplus]